MIKLAQNSHKFQLELLANLSLFLNRGYSLNEAMNLLKYRYNLENYISKLEEGYLLSEILKDNNFDPDILLVLEISEKSGNLKLGIEKSYYIIEQKQKNKNQIFELLKYPIMLGVILLIALVFVSSFLSNAINLPSSGNANAIESALNPVKVPISSTVLILEVFIIK